MPTREEIKHLIKANVQESIIRYVNRPVREAHFQVLDLIIPNERKIRSKVGGLETSMGKTLWEPLAKTLALGNGFEIIQDRLLTPTNMPDQLANTISNISRSRFDQDGLSNADSCHQAIKAICQRFINNPIDNFSRPPAGFDVDLWLRKDNINYFFDTKTVHPNIGKFKEFLTQLFNWYGYYYSRYPTGSAFARIVFPYNPFNGNFWHNSKGNGRPLEPVTEALVENDFWDLISGQERTFELIRQAFVELQEEGILTPHFERLFNR